MCVCVCVCVCVCMCVRLQPQFCNISYMNAKLFCRDFGYVGLQMNGFVDIKVDLEKNFIQNHLPVTQLFLWHFLY